jgi:hypothetical protein
MSMLPNNSGCPSASSKSGWIETARWNRSKAAPVAGGRLVGSGQSRLAKIVLATAVQKKTPVNKEFVQKTDSEGSTGFLDGYPQPPDQVLAPQAA